ncbi:MAG: aminoglycoside 6-adenylyltransferase [Bacteriovorax sp.]|nr:aminoglycoside 6-adenylyltransferase [Bacteriovorax sp.]
MIGQNDSALKLIDEIVKWAQEQSDISGVLLVGSYAQNNAKPDSDIDIMFFVSHIELLLKDQKWLNVFGAVVSAKHEDWGAVKTLRTFYEGGLEVEFNITTPAWATIDPIGPNTFRVISDGSQVLYDSEGSLAILLRAVQDQGISL